MDISAAQQVAQTFAPLGFALHEVLPTALNMSASMMQVGSLPIGDYPSQFAHNTIGVAHNRLRTEDLGPWQLDKSASRKQLHLSTDMWTVRLLGTNMLTGIPLAGGNTARQAFYVNKHVNDQTAAETLLDSHTFLIIWNVDPKTNAVELELIHTFKPWTMGQSEKVDLRMPLVADAAGVAALVFAPLTDDSLDNLGLVDKSGSFRAGTIDADHVPS